MTAGPLEPEIVNDIPFVEDADTRVLKDYRKYRMNIYKINGDHIKHGVKSDIIRNEMIQLLWDIHRHTEKQLHELGEIKIIEEQK